MGHLRDARRGAKGHRCNWIRSVLFRGFLPSITLIGKVDGDGFKDEVAWIKYFRDEGVNLVNETDGGEGMAGLVFSKEHKQKIVLSLLGNKRAVGNKSFSNHTHTKTAKTKMSLAKKGKYVPWIKGKGHSAKSREQMSVSQMGHGCSLETHRKMKLVHQNMTETTRLKMGASQKTAWVLRKSKKKY